ncbi:MAG: hypothetical protein F6K65_15495 [Moorea sp. SIO3C2]|nr:hypothetical protein [Moorena sp. SIO3C2]
MSICPPEKSVRTTKAIGRRPRYAPEAFRQSRRYANAKRGLRPQLPRLRDRTLKAS